MGMVVQDQTAGYVECNILKRVIWSIRSEYVEAKPFMCRVQDLRRAVWSTRCHGGPVEFKVEGGRVEWNI
jgi:hypothetical protein